MHSPHPDGYAGGGGRERWRGADPGWRRWDLTRLFDIALLLLGGYLSLRTIAACYRVLDLWYTIRTAYAQVIGGVLVWGGAAGLIGALLRSHHRQMYLWGLAGYPVFYLSLYVLRHLLLRDRAPSETTGV